MGILTKPVRGWRRYGVSIPGLLTSNDCVVMPRERAEAFCDGRSQYAAGELRPGKKCVGYPRADCSCGFYAFNSVDEYFREGGYVREGVIAEVAMWGTVHKFERGYRAQFCYPVRLWAYGALAESVRHRLQQEYMVPVGLLAVEFSKQLRECLNRREARARAERPLTEERLWDMVRMGDDTATKTLRARLSSAICTRRKAITRLEGEIKRNKEELQIKTAQREGLRRAR